MNPNLPSGTVTFLFTDIEGSTRLWQEKPQAMAVSHARHDAILRQAIESNDGYIFRTVGDSFHAAFRTALDGLQAALSAQRELQAESWGETGALRVRMGLHTGAAEISMDGSNQYFEGYTTIASAQRVMSVAHGEQVLLSQTTHDLLVNDLPEKVSLRDMGEHRLKDLRSPLRLYQLVVPGLAQDFPAIQSLDTLPNNLPLQLTSFIGRRKELADILELLESVRLITLTGSGGTGKTRLSQEVGAQALANFTHGVWFIELETLTDPSQIIPVMAQVFGLQEQPSNPLASLVVDYLREKDALLIFDNCEHLVDACARLADDFLHHCAGLKIIASSREALEIPGEVAYRLPPLAESELTQLFLERARQANPRFQATEANTAAITRICSRLDGIPLAIELAAARVKLLSPEQIATRLDDRFHLLVSGSRTALPRQQTLRALIDWSYDLLSEQECTLLRRLSVFMGGWTLEAAEAISPDLDVLYLLDQLINKSLVFTMEGKTATRYRLLETIRQYGRQKLVEAGELEATADKHARYFLQLAIDSENKLNTAEAFKWMDILEADHENLRATLEWDLKRDVESALKIIGVVTLFWSGRGYPAEGRAWAEAAIACAEALPPVEGEAAIQRKKLVAYALGSLLTLLVYHGDIPNAEIASEKCAALARELGDNKLLAKALTYFCTGRLVTGDTRDVEAKMNEALQAARLSGDANSLGLALGITAELLMLLDKDPETMQAYIKESIALLQETGDLWGFSIVSVGLGMGAKFKGRYEEARARFSVLQPVLHEIGDEHRLNLIQSELAHLDRYEGHFEKAERKYHETIVKWQKLGHRAAVAHQLEALAFIAIAQERLERAARLLGAAQALRDKIHIQMSPAEQVEYDKEVTNLRGALDELRFTTLWNEGRSMTTDRTIQFALETAPSIQG